MVLPPDHPPNDLAEGEMVIPPVGLTAPPGSVVETVAENGNTPFELSIYQTPDLTDANGRIPEEMVADKILQSFREGGRDIRIVRGLPPQNVGDRGSGCGSNGALSSWQQVLSLAAPFVAWDSNLLIMNTEGGGCAVPRGNFCTAPGALITDRRPDREGSGPWYRNISACMHEVGHTMNWGHCGDDQYRVHPGWGANIDGRWHRTPEMACTGIDNLCGEPIPTRQHDEVVNHLSFHDCSFENMEIIDKPALPDGGSGGRVIGGAAIAGVVVALFFLGRPEVED